MKLHRGEIFALALVLVAFVVTGALYSRLPERIPSHWNIRGEVDSYSSKPFGPFVLPAVMAGLALIFLALPAVSPRGFRFDRFRGVWGVLQSAILALLLLVHALVLLSAMGKAGGHDAGNRGRHRPPSRRRRKFLRQAHAKLLRGHPNALDARLGRSLDADPPAGRQALRPRRPRDVRPRARGRGADFDDDRRRRGQRSCRWSRLTCSTGGSRASRRRSPGNNPALFPEPSSCPSCRRGGACGRPPLPVTTPRARRSDRLVTSPYTRRALRTEPSR